MITKASKFGGGDGTEGNPYQIETAGHLLLVVRSNLDKHFILKRDIDLIGASDFEPIGGGENGGEFTGSFDGKGKKIKNIVG